MKAFFSALILLLAMQAAGQAPSQQASVPTQAASEPTPKTSRADSSARPTKRVRLEGKVYEVPADATMEEIKRFIEEEEIERLYEELAAGARPDCSKALALLADATTLIYRPAAALPRLIDFVEECADRIPPTRANMKLLMVAHGRLTNDYAISVMTEDWTTPLLERVSELERDLDQADGAIKVLSEGYVELNDYSVHLREQHQEALQRTRRVIELNKQVISICENSLQRGYSPPTIIVQIPPPPPPPPVINRTIICSSQRYGTMVQTFCN